MELKTPKGTTDTPPQDALIYEDLIHKTREIFKLYGALPIDTPVFELKSILMNKYGEDTKLIYDLKETGGEICALRYDLTVPFSRFMNCNKLKKLKRYQFGKVYRRDQPSLVKGRLREFTQADFDIAGDGSTAQIECELLNCANRLLSAYDIGKYVIRINDRRVLFGMMDACGIQQKLYGTICSTIDKMDKLSLEEVNTEMKSKGLDEVQIDKLNTYIKICGGEEVIQFLKEDVVYEKCKEGIDNLSILYKYCQVLGFSTNIVIDLSLARGLEYYTGLILEGVYKNKMGSVLGGGRYDELVGSLSNKGHKTPCAGFSIGLTRIFYLVKDKYNVSSSTQVFVSASGGLFVEERMKILNMLWDAGIKAETFYTKRANLSDHKQSCIKRNINYIVLIGEKEWNVGSVILLDVVSGVTKDLKISELIFTINNK